MKEHDFIIENHLNGAPVDLVVGIPSFNEADSIGFIEGRNAYHRAVFEKAGQILKGRREHGQRE